MAPADRLLRLELGVAQLRAGDWQAAAKTLDAIPRQTLTPAERRAIANLRARAVPRPRFSHDFALALAPETNPDRRTSAQRVTLGGLDFALNPDAQAAPATGVEGTLGLGYRHPLSRDRAAETGLSLRLRLYDDPTLNEARLGLRGGLAWTGDRSTRLRLFARVEGRWRGGDQAHRALGLGTSLERRLTPRGLGFVVLSVDRYDVARSSTRDGTQLAMTAGIAQTLTPRWRLTPSVAVVRYNAQADAHSYWDIEVRARAEAQLSRFHKLEARIALGRATHDGPSGLEGIRRKDRSGTINLRLADSRLAFWRLQPFLEVGFDKTISTSALSTYENLRGAVLVEWRRSH